MTWPQQATIHGIRMQLSHFVLDVPVYWYQLNNTQFNYINHNLKIEDLQ